MQQKFGDVNMDDLKMKLDGVKQKLRQQSNYILIDWTSCLGRVKSRMLNKSINFLCIYEIKKLCMVKTFANVEEILSIAKEVEKMLGELGEIPFEPLKEE